MFHRQSRADHGEIDVTGPHPTYIGDPHRALRFKPGGDLPVRNPFVGHCTGKTLMPGEADGGLTAGPQPENQHTPLG